MIEFSTSSLMREVNAVVAASTPTSFTWTAKIHVGKKLTYLPIKVISIDFLSDYESNYSDEILLTLAITGGQYAIDIYPYKDQLEITLISSPIGEVADVANIGKPIQTERYSATLIDKGNPAVEGNTRYTPTKESLDLSNVTEVTFQLVNKAIQQLRLISVGGTYRGITAGDVLKTVLTNESKNIKVDGARLPAGVDMVPGYNPTVREHVIIPQGTKLVDVPEYLHVKCGGIYPTGLGYYLQGDHWYVYPCYDITRIAKADSILTIINVPPHKLPGIERTYKTKGKNTTILATGSVKFRDDSEVQQLNAGNGVRYADANNFMGGFGKTVNNKTTLSRGKNNTEVKAQIRTNGVNNVPISDNNINANPYLEFSKLARRNCATITLIWENSLPSIIKPNSMCKIMYIDNDRISTIFGIILKVHSYVQLRDTGMLATRYITRTSIVIACNIVRDGS